MKRSEMANATMNTDNYNFTFDDIGNREDYSLNNGSVEYDCNSVNQYVNKSFSNMGTNFFTSYHHDSDGNLVDYSFSYNDGSGYQQQFAWIYTWNAENRLTSVTNYLNDVYVTYKYDYQGRMFEKVTNGTTNNFIWNGNHIIAEFTDSSTNYFAWSNGETICADLDGETVFYCHDANKNVTDLVDDLGTHLVHYDYSPFGVQSSTVYSSPLTVSLNPFRFSNEYFDETTGFVEYKYRPYLPPLGKFLSLDPIGEKGSFNLYQFCNNNAINYWDNLGREPKASEPAKYELIDFSSFIKWRYELVYANISLWAGGVTGTRAVDLSLPGKYPARRYRNKLMKKIGSQALCWKAHHIAVYAEPILGFDSKGSIGSPFDSKNRLRFEPQIAIVEHLTMPDNYSKTWSQKGVIYGFAGGLKATGKYKTFATFRIPKNTSSIKLDIYRRINRTYLEYFLDEEEKKADYRAVRNVPVISDTEKYPVLKTLSFELLDETKNTL